MPVLLYMDVHVPYPITEQLRRRGVDVLTVIEDRSDELADDELLEHAGAIGRVIVTQDIRFRAMAEDWQRQAGAAKDTRRHGRRHRWRSGRTTGRPPARSPPALRIRGPPAGARF